MTDPSLWNQALVWPIINLLAALYKGFELIYLPGALGWAIVALTAFVRLALYPLTQKQLVSARKMQNLKPHLDEIQKKHKEDKVKLQQAQLQLYKDHGINPASGCLPLLVQIPVFIALYNVFIQILGGNTEELIKNINTILYSSALHIDKLNLDFFGINLASKPNEWQTVGVGLLLVPVITGLLQFVQTRLMSPSKKTLAIVQKPQEEDPMQSMQKQMGLIMPVMIGFFSLSFPIGLSLYWNTFTLFGIIQQLSVNKKH